MSDILFTGEFDLAKSYSTFDKFLDKIEARLLQSNKTVSAKVSQQATQQNQNKIDDRINQLYQDLSVKAFKAGEQVKASQDRIRTAIDEGRISIDSGNKAIIRLDETLERYQKTLRNVELREEENIKANKSQVLALRQLDDAYDALREKITRTESKLNSGNETFRNATTFSKEFFKGLAIGGFALQQVGATLTQYLTQPIENLGKRIFDSLLVFDAFNEKLKFYGKSVEEIQKYKQAIQDTAKRPNITLEETIDLFDKLINLTEGNIIPERLEAIGKGLSVAFIGTPEKQRRSVLGELNTILGTEGGETTNLNRTLNNAVLLKQKIQDILGGESVTPANIENAGFTQQEIILKALEELAKRGVPETLANQVDNLSDKLFTLAGDIGAIYEDRIKVLFDYVDKTVIPTLDRLRESLADAPSYVQDLVLGFTVVLAAIGPVISIIGLLAVAIAGLGYLFDTIGGIIAYYAGTAAVADAATAGLAATAAEAGGAVSAITSILGGLGTAITATVEFLSGFGIVIVAIVAGIIYAATQFEFVSNAVKALGVAIYESISPLFSIFGSLGTLLYDLVKVIVVILGYVLAPFLYIALKLLVFLVTALSIPLRVLAAILEFVVDVIEKGFVFAMKKMELAFAEIQESIVGTIPYLKEFFDYLARWAGGETNTQRIARLKQEMAALSKTTEKATDAAKKDREEKEKTEKINKQLAKSIEKINDLIADQTQKLREETAALEEQKLASANQQQNIADIATSRNLERQSEKYDLANPNQSKKAVANFDSLSEIQLNQKRRDVQLEFIKSENQFKLSLQDGLSKLELKNKDLRAIIDRNFNNSANVNNADLIQSLRTDISWLSGEEATATLQAVNRAGQRLGILRQSYDLQFTEINKFVAERNQQRIDLQEKIKKAEKGAAVSADVGALNSLRIDYQTQLDAIEDEVKETEKLEIGSTEKYNKLLALYDKINAVKVKIANVEIGIAERQIQPETETEDRQKIAQNKIDVQKDLQADSDNRTRDAANKIYEGRKNAQEIIDKAFTLSLGVSEKTAAYQKLTQEIADKQNIALQGIRYDALADSDFLEAAFNADRDLEKIGGILDSFKSLSSSGKLSTNLKGLNDFFTNIPKITGSLTANSLDEQLAYVEGLLKSLTSVDIQKLSQEEGFAYDDFLKILDLVTKTTAKLREAKTKSDDKVRDDARKQRELANIENKRRLDELKDLEDVKSLEQEIYDIRSQRTLGSESGLGTAIYDILTGAREKAYKLEKDRLELAGQIRELEIQLVIDRLKGEQLITLERLRGAAGEAGLTDEERKRREEAYEDYKRVSDQQVKMLEKRKSLEGKLSAEQIRGLKKYGGTLGEILTGAVGKAFKKVLKGKNKEKQEPAVNDESTDKTAQNSQEQIGWLDKLTGKMGAVRDVAFAVGDALMSLEELSLQSILKSIKAELDALAKKALIKALEYAALATSALVFGDVPTAVKAGKAAAAWGAVAVDAKVGSALVNLGIKKDTEAAQKKSDMDKDTSSDKEEKKRIARMKAQEIVIRFDIHTEEGILMQKQVKAINSNTKLTTLTSNSQSGYSFPPA